MIKEARYPMAVISIQRMFEEARRAGYEKEVLQLVKSLRDVDCIVDDSTEAIEPIAPAFMRRILVAGGEAGVEELDEILALTRLQAPSARFMDTMYYALVLLGAKECIS